jgi:phosphoribosylformylglycinamidine synthase PurS subunit
MRFTGQVHIQLKPGVNDPQGNAVQHGLHALGFSSVSEVRVGKYLTLQLEAADAAAARRALEEMCDRLLANPVIESYRAEVEPAAG